MELMEAAKLRQSIRSYKADTVISKETIDDIIGFANLAPSWKNFQASRYYAVTDPEMVKKIKTECLPDFNRKNVADAPALIVATYLKSIAGFDKDGSPSNHLGEGCGAYDLGLQNAYLILRASDLGLDTLLMGIYNEPRLRELLSIPESEEIVVVISLGERKDVRNRPVRKDVSELVKYF